MPLSVARHEQSGRDAERIRDGMDVVERDVALAALHGADVGAVDAHERCEGLLRMPALAAQLTHAPAEGPSTFQPDRLGSARHEATLSDLLTIQLQTIRSIHGSIHGD